MRVTYRVMSLLAVGMVSLAGTARAQGATFSTEGYFTGSSAASADCTATASSVASCHNNSYTLQFQGTSVDNTIGAINFGQFDLTLNPPLCTNPNLGAPPVPGVNCVVVPIEGNSVGGPAPGKPASFGPFTAGELEFHLIINQTDPSTGSQTEVGEIDGQVTSGGVNNSTLIFSPKPATFSIGDATYSYKFDAGNPLSGYQISLDTHHKTTFACPIGSSCSSNALAGTVNVTSTPEPGSIALFATGFAGLIPVVIRRRKNVSAK